MRADLARREPEWLARWAKERQYERVLEERLRDEAPEYVLHDGPPYATGAIHYGTAMNKVLKDIVVRSQLLMGKRAVYRPGWDCHGLPIEQQVEKNLGKDARGAGRGRVPAALRRARDEVRRRHAHGVQAARLPRPLGRPVPDAGQGLRGDDRAPAGRLRRARASSTATRSPCTGASSTARRWPRQRSSTRTTPRRRSTCASRSSATSARPSRACATSAPRSSSGRRPPGRCPRTWPSSPIRSSTTSRSRATGNT